MTERIRNNYIAILIVILLIFLGFTLGGCAGDGLKIKLATPDKEVSLETDYQIENGFYMRRDIETGEYEIELGSATTKDAEMGVVIEMMRMMQTMWMQSMGMPIPAQPPVTNTEE